MKLIAWKIKNLESLVMVFPISEFQVPIGIHKGAMDGRVDDQQDLSFVFFHGMDVSDVVDDFKIIDGFVLHISIFSCLFHTKKKKLGKPSFSCLLSQGKDVIPELAFFGILGNNIDEGLSLDGTKKKFLVDVL